MILTHFGRSRKKNILRFMSKGFVGEMLIKK